MSRRVRIERVLAVIGAAAVLVMGFDTLTFAATGSSLLLGKTNTANTVTIVKNTGAGAALNLQTASSAAPPFVTNARGLVAGLFSARAANADKLGGKTLAQINAALTTAPFHAVPEPFGTGGQGSGWMNFGQGSGSVGYQRNAAGMVSLAGLACPRFLPPVPNAVAQCSPFTPNGSPAFNQLLTLPVGFRPAQRMIFAVDDTERFGRIDVLPTGEVLFLVSTGVSHNYISLDGISFQAAG